MIETKAAFSADQVQAVLFVLGSLAISNIASLVGAVWSHFRRIAKMRRDINIAFQKIRALEEENQNKETKSV